ncbi:rubredoxin [Methanocella sp. CWC-04]|uniref:Rubredoxin n=1 Tax=Methanooceanicella nereidis TaxID=2052831 RepID=A0AAP2RA62_9EURY|nr:rubredoxin [Methanocella sp. CWC-04]MCD1293746.1 rubredoxin [Methanocella sp. CWC-04]
MSRWRCTICEYVYDPADGDTQYPVPPGTAFEDLPDDWTCPLCGAEKALFEKIEE